MEPAALLLTALLVLAVSVDGGRNALKGRTFQTEAESVPAPTAGTETWTTSFTDPTAQGLPCMSPALLKGDLHVVIGGHDGIASCMHWHVAEMGLTNAEVFVYRRRDDTKPLESASLPCGVTAHERLVLPNHGRDAQAFYSYVVEHYNSLPRLGVIFMHGHGHSWHMTCEATFARSRLWYRHAAMRGPMADRMVTLYSHGEPPWDDVNTNWTGPPIERLLSEADAGVYLDEDAEVDVWPEPEDAQPPSSTSLASSDGILAEVKSILQRWNITLHTAFQSCCASFIVPSRRIRQIPLGAYEDLLRVVTEAPDDEVSGRLAFEYLVWRFWNDAEYDETAQEFYRASSRMYGALTSHAALRRCQANGCGWAEEVVWEDLAYRRALGRAA